MTIVRFAMAGPGGVGAMARLARVGRVFIRQQPAGEIKLVGGGFIGIAVVGLFRIR